MLMKNKKINMKVIKISLFALCFSMVDLIFAQAIKIGHRNSVNDHVLDINT